MPNAFERPEPRIRASIALKEKKIVRLTKEIEAVQKEIETLKKQLKESSH